MLDPACLESLLRHCEWAKQNNLAIFMRDESEMSSVNSFMEIQKHLFKIFNSFVLASYCVSEVLYNSSG